MLGEKEANKIGSENINIVSSEVAVKNCLKYYWLIKIILQLFSKVKLGKHILVKLLQFHAKLALLFRQNKTV